MLAQSIRASRQALARVARQQPTIARRTFITPTAVRSADLVQDLYLRELKNYKVPQVKANDAEGHVQKFSIPAAPKSPEEADIANELKAYETQQPDVGSEATAEDGQVLPDEDWFVEEDESITTPGATH
ncbi:ATP synthase F0 subcomplex subunit H atp14 [Nothophoma quercina]|uniref:ATP synthase F0 subcomplex subunit H atp14 n=1 Tax=Nothophoma quercina TaxID=749835 RepID=A0ABR3RRK7_9PLEO